MIHWYAYFVFICATTITMANKPHTWRYAAVRPFNVLFRPGGKAELVLRELAYSFRSETGPMLAISFDDGCLEVAQGEHVLAGLVVRADVDEGVVEAGPVQGLFGGSALHAGGLAINGNSAHDSSSLDLENVLRGSVPVRAGEHRHKEVASSTLASWICSLLYAIWPRHASYIA